MPSFSVARRSPVSGLFGREINRIPDIRASSFYGGTLPNPWENQVMKSVETSEFLSREQRLREALKELDFIKDDWNSYGADAPSEKAITAAWLVFASLREADLYPDRVLPSAEGGVAFTFLSATDNRAAIEMLNSEEKFVLLYDLDGNSKTLEWNSFEIPKALIEGIKEHLRGSRLAVS